MKTDVSVVTKESKSIMGLNIENVNGGHKILMDGSDRSFAMVRFDADGVDTITIRMLSPNKDHESDGIYFGPYKIFVLEVGWNGEVIRLSVEKSEL